MQCHGIASPLVGDRRWAVGDRRWAVGDRRWAVGDLWWAVGDRWLPLGLLDGRSARSIARASAIEMEEASSHDSSPTNS